MPITQAILSMHEIAGKNLEQRKRQRLIVEKITSGRDELAPLGMIPLVSRTSELGRCLDGWRRRPRNLRSDIGLWTSWSRLIILDPDEGLD